MLYRPLFAVGGRSRSFSPAVGLPVFRKHLGRGSKLSRFFLGFGSGPSGSRLTKDIGKLGIRKSVKIRKIEKVPFDPSITDAHGYPHRLPLQSAERGELAASEPRPGMGQSRAAWYFGQAPPCKPGYQRD